LKATINQWGSKQKLAMVQQSRAATTAHLQKLKQQLTRVMANKRQ